MATVIIRIDTDNSAFGETVEETVNELRSIVKQGLADIYYRQKYQAKLYDTNGNCVGFISLE